MSSHPYQLATPNVGLDAESLKTNALGDDPSTVAWRPRCFGKIGDGAGVPGTMALDEAVAAGEGFLDSSVLRVTVDAYERTKDHFCCWFLTPAMVAATGRFERPPSCR